MADNALRTLLYLIEGEYEPFAVNISGDDNIYNLKDLIRENHKHGGALSSVNAADLTLWKVRMIMASDSTTNSPAG